MPISKLPVVHKFGIISLSKAEQLIRQERLKQQNKKDKASSKSTSATSCPIITLDFIAKYNSSSETDKESQNGIIRRVLEHAKYKSHSPSTVHPNDISDPDVSEGWLELIMLCQCYGLLQEECLSTLVMSLFCSPVSPSHIPALFYMSGLCYHWLKSENVSSSTIHVLRTGELLLLKVLYGISLRLYHHHLTGVLQNLCSKQEVIQLKFDLEGFDCCQKTYKNFPEALLQWKVALEVGQLICDKYDRQTNLQTPVSPTNTASTNCTKSSTNGGHGDHDVSSILWHALDIWQCVHQGCDSLTEAIQDLVSCSTDFNTQQWLEGLLAMNILCHTARQSADVLQFMLALASNDVCSVIQDDVAQLNETGNASIRSTSVSRNSERTDHVISTSYKPRDVATLNVLGMQPKFNIEETEGIEDNEQEEDEDDTVVTGNTSHMSVTTQALLDAESIPDIFPSATTVTTLDSSHLSTVKNSSATEQFSRPSDLLQTTSSEADAGKKNKRVTLGTATNIEQEYTDDICDDTNHINSSAESSINRIGLLDDRFDFMDKKGNMIKSVTLTLPPPRDVDSRCTHYTHSTAPFSWGAGVLGSQVPPSTVYQMSLPSCIDKDRSSTVLSLSVVDQSNNFKTWSSDIKIAYTLNMSNIVMYGKDSNISRMALLGQDEAHKMYSLVELASYNDLQFGLKSSDDPDSWKVRHCALLGLLHIVQYCSQDPTRDGFSSTAWSILQNRERIELEAKVSEARKMQKVSQSPHKNSLSPRVPSTSLFVPSLFGDMAQQLSKLYLPPLTIDISSTLKQKAKKMSPEKLLPLKITGKPKVDTGRSKDQKLNNSQPVGYVARTNNALNAIAEKHWMMQMEAEEEEEKQMMKEFEQQRQLEEDKKLERKREKLSKNHTPDKEFTLKTQNQLISKK